MAREPDSIVRIVASGEVPDQVVGVVGDQVLTATPADVGKVVTVAADGTLVLAAGGEGGGVTDHGDLDGLADDDHPQYADDAHVHAAGAVTFTPVGNISATSAGGAIAELEQEKATTGSVTAVATSVSDHEADTSVHGIADTSTLYRSGGTDVAVADGGTGASSASTALANLGAVPAATLDANSVLYAVTDDTPAALAMGASTILARLAAGNIVAATPAELRTLLALVVGTNVQAYDAELAAIAGLTSAADKLPYFTGAGTAGVTDLTTFIRTLLDDASAAAARATLGAEGLLAHTTYKAGSDVAAGTTTNTTLTNVDATNLTVTFTAPPSGVVTIRLEALCDCDTVAVVYWGLLDGAGAAVTGAEKTYVHGVAATIISERKVCVFKVASLTPGNSYTYKWAHAGAGSSKAVRVYTGPTFGFGIMEVRSSPLA